jgi:hypothetical protein
VTQADLDCLKTHIDQVVEIETQKGERLLINVISVFDEESDPDVFFHDVTADPNQESFERTPGYGLPLREITAVKEYTAQGGRA